jgi:hypothetical protein
MTRIFFASLIGSVAMFVWTHLAFTSLRIGYAGLHRLPNENEVLDRLQKAIGEKSGLYIFPSLRLEQTSAIPRDEPVNRLSQKVARYPSGILIYNAAGSRPIEMFRWLLIEFFTELAEAVITLFLLSCTRLRKYAARIGFVLLVGIVASVATNVPHWNWYGFSPAYILPYMMIQVVGYLLLGVVAAIVLRKQSFLPARAGVLPESRNFLDQ